MPGKKKTEPVNWEEYNRRIDLSHPLSGRYRKAGQDFHKKKKGSGKNLTSLVWTFSPVKNAVATV